MLIDHLVPGMFTNMSSSVDSYVRALLQHGFDSTPATKARRIPRA